MKRKLATMAIVGAMAVTAVAPATVFAATGQTNVTYIAGAVAPGGEDSGYYVTIPADIMFTDGVKTGTQELELVAMEDVALPSDLSVSVEVSSNGDAQLTQAGGTNKLAYTVTYDEASVTGATAGNGTLKTGTSSNVSVGTFTGEGTLTGTATLTKTAEEAGFTVAKGTQFTDVLTYTIEQTTPTVSP